MLHTGSDIWDGRTEERQGLTLHVRAHESTGRVVVVEEGDASRGDRNDLLRRDVDEIDEGTVDGEVVFVMTDDDFGVDDFPNEEVAFALRAAFPDFLQFADLAEFDVGFGDV